MFQGSHHYFPSEHPPTSKTESSSFLTSDHVSIFCPKKSLSKLFHYRISVETGLLTKLQQTVHKMMVQRITLSVVHVKVLSEPLKFLLSISPSKEMGDCSR